MAQYHTIDLLEVECVDIIGENTTFFNTYE
jgi:hypothetical protein